MKASDIQEAINLRNRYNQIRLGLIHLERSDAKTSAVPVITIAPVGAHPMHNLPLPVELARDCLQREEQQCFFDAKAIGLELEK